MGGNAKYKGARMRTATYNETDGTRKAVTDSNGNIIRVGVGPQVGKGKRTNTTMATAKERIQNDKALKQIRDMAKDVRKLRRQMSNGTYLGPTWELVGKIDTKVLKLSAMANQVDSNVKLNMAGFAQFDDIERVLGIKLS